MSPAGHWPQLRAAIEAGADAVYFGLKHFSARAKVGFSLEELPDVMRTLHARGVRGYLTFNTLIFEHEIDEAVRTAERIIEAGADALIVQDLGILKTIRGISRDVEIHASTQMSITDAAGVRFALSMGADRVTLARELSLAEVSRIREETGATLEMFVHGALCVAYSGQCFSSEAWGGRSANRGQCAQACRLPYDLIVDGAEEPLGDARYLLSPGDLYTLKEIPAIVQSGVAALKIEGRYKDADYVAITTQAYRRAVDEAWAGRRSAIAEPEEIALEQVYSRGLGPYFVTGTNHQAVVRGRAPRHRGLLMGTVVRIEEDAIVVQPSARHDLAPLKAGDGLVFDAADWRSPEEPEEGGRVYESVRRRDGKIELRFGNRAVRLDRIRPGDLVWRTDDPQLHERARPFTENAVPVSRQTVDVVVRGAPGQRLSAEWRLRRHTEIAVKTESAGLIETAQNRGLAEGVLREQLGRLGNTPYELGTLSMEIEGSVFAPTSWLNQMRREAVERLQELQSRAPRRELHDPGSLARRREIAAVETPSECQLHLLVRTPEQMEAAIGFRPASITLDYLDLYGLRPSVERVKAAGITGRVASPRVLKPGEEKILNFLLGLDCQILARSTGILEMLRNRPDVQVIGDFSLNAANSLSAAEYLDLGLLRVTPTHDLNAAQVAQLARDIGAEAVEALAYQHLPVFHTEHCVFCRFLSTGTSYKDCGRPCEQHRVAIRDSSGRAHPLMADVGCRNTVFGAEAQEASTHLESWIEAGIRHFRLEFVHETAAEVANVAELFRAALQGEITVKHLNRELKAAAPAGTTQGSLFVPAQSALLPVL